MASSQQGFIVRAGFYVRLDEAPRPKTFVRQKQSQSDFLWRRPSRVYRPLCTYVRSARASKYILRANIRYILRANIRYILRANIRAYGVRTADVRTYSRTGLRISSYGVVFHVEFASDGQKFVAPPKSMFFAFITHNLNFRDFRKNLQNIFPCRPPSRAAGRRGRRGCGAAATEQGFTYVRKPATFVR